MNIEEREDDFLAGLEKEWDPEPEPVAEKVQPAPLPIPEPEPAPEPEPTLTREDFEGELRAMVKFCGRGGSVAHGDLLRLLELWNVTK